MSRFARLLLWIVLAGLAVRVGYVAIVVWDEPLKGDQVYYTAEANRIAQGFGFVEPYSRDLNVRRPGSGPSAEHPPLTVVTLAPVAWALNHLPGLDVDTRRGDIHGPAFRLTFALVGSIGVLLVGLLGREVGGDRVGLVAAGIAAVYPNLWVNDGVVMSETLTVVASVWVLLLAYRYRRAPRARTAVGLGIACGLAALARAEMILLVPFLALPIVMLDRGNTENPADDLDPAGGVEATSRRRWRVRGTAVAVVLATTAVVVGPWTVFNITRFEDTTFLSTNDGQTLLGANCPPAYRGAATGLWLLNCLPEVPGDRSQVSTEYRRRAIEYIRDDLDRVPAVVAIRVGRLWSVYRPGDMIWYNDGEGREQWISRLGLWFFYPILVLAAAGVLVLRRAWARLWPLLVPILLVTGMAALTYGQVRFRSPAEPSLVVLAAVAIDAFLRARIDRSTPTRTEPEDRQLEAAR